MISVEIVFALPTKATTLTVEVAQGTTAEQAVIQSGIIDKCPEIDPTALTLGVWNRTVKAHYELKDGDRIEIYRPLIADPKDARRKRAENAKEEGRAKKVSQSHLFLITRAFTALAEYQSFLVDHNHPKQQLVDHFQI